MSLNLLSSIKDTFLSTGKMLPKRLLRLRSKNPNESTMIVCIFLWLPASQTPKTAGVEPPGIMEFKSLHPLTAGLQGTKGTSGSRGHCQSGHHRLHRYPHHGADECSRHRHTSKSEHPLPLPGGESIPTWASGKGHQRKLTGGCQPKQTNTFNLSCSTLLKWETLTTS